MKMINLLAVIIAIIGGVNWGLIGLAEFNLITAIFGDASLITRGIYIAAGVSAIYLLINIKHFA